MSDATGGIVPADPELDGRVLELRRAGVGVPRIADNLGLPLEEVEVRLARGREALGVPLSPMEVRSLELDRLDRLQQGVWAKAVKGDIAAIDRVLRLSEMRIKLAGVPAEARLLSAAFERTIEALGLGEVDTALVESGRRLADHIDSAAASGDPVASSKALWLVPHLVNVLRDLGATPAAREAVADAAPAPMPEVENELERFKASRGRAG